LAVTFLQHTTTFHEVCEAGSFRRAAQVLGVSVSTVSRQLDQLEEHLGTKLVERSSRRVTLTEAGRIYREHAAAAVGALRGGEDAVREVLTHPAGRLTVAAPAELVRGVVGRAAIAYLRSFPGVRLELLAVDQDLLPDGTAVHLVLAATRTPPPDHVVRRSLRSIPMRLCASRDYLAAAGDLAHPTELATRGCVVLGAGPRATHVPFVGPSGACTVVVGAALFTTSVALARRAALDGLGPAGLPLESCAADLERGRLVEMLPGWQLADVPLVAYTAHRVVPMRVRAFLEVLDAHL
jgi:DNA-binding transcriptional LysR family regulator